MTAKRDYYEVLGISRNAGSDEIKQAFRKLAFQYHPDKNPGADAADKFKEASEAYQVLCDQEKRQAYDRFGHAGVDGATRGFEGFGGMGSIFEDFYNFFGDAAGGRNASVRGEDIHVSLDLTFEEAALGADKEIRIQRSENCSVCHGSGAKPGTQPQSCPECKGSGRVQRVQQSLFGRFTNVISCPRCSGSGQIITDACPNCRGSGHERFARNINLSVPAGVDNGIRMQMSGQGHAGERGGMPGNLMVSIRVKPHEFFKREDSNIIYNLKVNFAQAALGVDLTVPTIYGDAQIKILAGSQGGEVFTLKGKGIPHFRRSGKGDQLVCLTVVTPSKLTKEQRSLFEELAVSFEAKKK
ncbi:MAG: molecular chaperone DnaJ [Dehalococcoidia bacterium]|nr:molecular chaperone DnaJ [Dehalococcoidia bacterium]